MTDVQFEEDNQFGSGGSFQSRRILGIPTTPGLVRLLGKLGIRNEKVAGYILVAIALVAFTASIFIFAGVSTGGSSSSQNIIPPGEFTRPL
ncbi:MAG: hypothetical protein CEO19_312 [Parcubacteria group bacterium Gr01-1014_73]|nr:MAG: hypothetical protein CEO19_312 [Parcubacteria group bacterium Gr01-1014_73]